MSTSELLSILHDYGGVLVGLALLIVAVSVLPSRIRWYVLTAGLGILGYEAYVRWRSKKLLAEADGERRQLEKRASELDARAAGLAQEVARLNEELAKNQAVARELAGRAEDLEGRGAALSEQRQRLDDQIRQESIENQKLLEKVNAHQQALAALRNAKQAVDGLGGAAPQEGVP